ncbi:PepSY domain-containing protein [Pararhizobium haloflavum]|uniref:PepSY domain-containing protein n=1 Tax=Pararhizobium haloflavum TaxID=2037914 RepID=UPI000C19EBDE|nr:PepSY domain-containing protein [Pararhizobium haloflavum]
MTVKNTLSRKSIFAAAGIPILMLSGSVLAQTVSIEQLDASGGLSIEGEVRDVFGNRFVIEDDTGRILVETGPARGQSYDLREGERLTVFGEPDGDSFDAFRIVREDGTEIEVRRPSGPPPWAGQGESGRQAPDGPRQARLNEDEAAAVLRDAGFSDVRLEERDEHHYEFDATDVDGRAVEIELMFDGSFKKVEVDSGGAAQNADFRALLPEGVQRALDERGVVDIREFDAKPRHYEVEGFDAEGREIEMDIENDGRIRKVEIDDRAAPPQATVDEAGLRERVEANGYTFEGNVERKPRHFEVRATNPEGEPVELHVDLNGEIYKEQLRR